MTLHIITLILIVIFFIVNIIICYITDNEKHFYYWGIPGFLIIEFIWQIIYDLFSY